MLLSHIIKQGLEDHDPKNCYRYFLAKIDSLNCPVFVELKSENSRKLNINMYETDLFTFNDYPMPYIGNPFNKINIIDRIMTSVVKDRESPTVPRPICSVNAIAWDNNVTIHDLYTREDMRRLGLASYSLKLIQDYFARNKEVCDKFFTNGRAPILYAPKTAVDKNLKYKTVFEENHGAFGELISNIKSKIRGNNSSGAYRDFLLKNHFNYETHPLHVSSRPMRKRDILKDDIINMEHTQNNIQVYDHVLDFDPKLLNSDLRLFDIR